MVVIHSESHEVRHNETNLNLGIVKLNIQHTKYRANLALQSGTYVNDNYASEPITLKNIAEANIGISLNKRNNLWLDAGIMPSHIGFESAISMDNQTLTRSLLAENSPYFMAGAKLTCNPSRKIEIAGLLLNGWQRIQRQAGNSFPHFGTQIKFTPSENILVNWSTFIGTNTPDQFRRMRYFNNLYGQFNLSKKISLTTGFDLGIEQNRKPSKNGSFWFSPVIIAQYNIHKKWKAAIRAEYYEDYERVILPYAQTVPDELFGYSLNVDYSPAPHIICRLEGRFLSSSPTYSEISNTDRFDNFTLAASLAMKISKELKPNNAAQ